jgi:Phosphodiester glycosidase
MCLDFDRDGPNWQIEEGVSLTIRSWIWKTGPGAAAAVGTLLLAASSAAVVSAGNAVPARIAPRIRPPLPGEGVWRPGSFRWQGSAPVLVTSFRPDPANPGIVAYAAWLDHRRTELALYPGLSEPPSVAVRGSGDVPSGQRWRLLATFNGGFKANAGAGGFLINGHADVPLRDGLGTLVEHRNGRVDIVSWHGPPSLGYLVLARQNLPLIVNNGRPNPTLNDSAQWGATLGGAAAVWRSAVGIDRHGNLLYAAADAQTAPSLAALMVELGAVRAIELDINPEWPSFIGYGRRGGRDPIKLVPNNQQSSARWLVPDSRDFFAVYTSGGGGPSVPFR